MNFQGIGWGGKGVDWIDPVQDSDKWRFLVNMVMNFPCSTKCGESSRLAEELSAAEGPCDMG